MKDEIFDTKIKPLMDVIENICNEYGIEFLAQYITNKETSEYYHYQSRDMLLDVSTILNQYEKWHIKNRKED